MAGMSVFPIIIITVIFTALLGLTIGSMEREQVVQNWDKTRCNLPIMVMAGYFKPATDPRTSSAFASDNFQFCMKQIVKGVMEIVMAPLVDVFGGQANSASGINTTLSSIREVIQVMYSSFMKYMKTYFMRFEQVAYQFSNIFQHLRLAMNRINGIAVSLIYMGLSVITGIMNTIDLFMVVIMIILGIMVALIILLFFVLFPVMPIIMSVISALLIVATGSTMGTLGSFRNSFCFRGDAPVVVAQYKNGHISTTIVPICQIKLGDILADSSTVTSVIETINDTESLYVLDGIFVAGSHVVQKTDGSWNMVADDSRAIISPDAQKEHIFCLNTTSHKITLMGNNGPIVFKDWEEYETGDAFAQMEWNFNVSRMINSSNTKKYNIWKGDITPDSSYPLLDPRILVNVKSGMLPIGDIKIGDFVYDSTTTLTKVLGIVRGTNGPDIDSIILINTFLSVDDPVWQRKRLSLKTKTMYGMTLITESGVFVADIGNENGLVQVRDYTEVGYRNIHKLYPLLLERLRIEHAHIQPMTN